jgi:hypothetical protein
MVGEWTMFDESEWEKIRASGSAHLGSAGMGALRITLLFGSAAVALALIIAPIVDNSTKARFADSRYPVGLDRVTTGSIPARRYYTIRRSVLQKSPSSVCIIGQGGARSGDC